MPPTSYLFGPLKNEVVEKLVIERKEEHYWKMVINLTKIYMFDFAELVKKFMALPHMLEN